jgi:hypothetical protein
MGLGRDKLEQGGRRGAKVANKGAILDTNFRV